MQIKTWTFALNIWSHALQSPAWLYLAATTLASCYRNTWLPCAVALWEGKRAARMMGHVAFVLVRALTSLRRLVNKNCTLLATRCFFCRFKTVKCGEHTANKRVRIKAFLLFLRTYCGILTKCFRTQIFKALSVHACGMCETDLPWEPKNLGGTADQERTNILYILTSGNAEYGRIIC